MRADLLRFKCQEGFTRTLAAAAATVFMGEHVVRGGGVGGESNSTGMNPLPPHYLLTSCLPDLQDKAVAAAGSAPC